MVDPVKALLCNYYGNAPDVLRSQMVNVWDRSMFPQLEERGTDDQVRVLAERISQFVYKVADAQPGH
ncbi:hypothetical protein VKT23_010721 [Stygiomarasmius scandens]|uniref:Uncharacterized protein n=1 Tax=Marasmiellus scandens TaxID=2682957 RepID=A0ABR1JF66_9AGAR